MITAISGCDGSGKSTLVKGIVALGKRRELDIQFIEEFDYTLLNPIAKHMKQQEVVRASFMSGDVRIKPLTLIWAHLVYFDLMLRALFHKFMKRNVVYDRYFIDYGIGFYNLTGLLYFIKLFKLSPKPDVAVYCQADVATLYKRRLQQGRQKSFYAKQLDNYHTHGNFDMIVDTGSNDTNINITVRKIVKNYEKR